jgi:hypothetical protein
VTRRTIRCGPEPCDLPPGSAHSAGWSVPEGRCSTWPTRSTLPTASLVFVGAYGGLRIGELARCAARVSSRPPAGTGPAHRSGVQGPRRRPAPHLQLPPQHLAAGGDRRQPGRPSQPRSSAHGRGPVDRQLGQWARLIQDARTPLASAMPRGSWRGCLRAAEPGVVDGLVDPFRRWEGCRIDQRRAYGV